MYEPTRAQFCGAIVKAGSILVFLWLELTLVFWLVGEFGAPAGLAIFFASLIGLTVIAISAMLLWYRRRPSASAPAP